VRARPVTILVSTLALAIALAGCGDKPKNRHVADAANNATYVWAGPVTYQLQIARQLNGYSTEDSQYLEGLPKNTTPPAPNQEWYGVFMWAWNQTKLAHYTASPSDFRVVDTQGNVYRPYPINPSQNAFAWTRTLLLPDATFPLADSPAWAGLTQGALLLFKIDTSAYANRPLVLHILGSAGNIQAVIPLDL
jgi:hypothetical protein